MSLANVFQFSVYLLAGLASLMLALAEGGAFPLAALSVPLVGLAYFFTERWGTLQISTLGANLLGLLAVLAAVTELLVGDEEARLLSGAHLLVYLLWIVLFQEKTSRQYWWMCALCVLHVAVGSVLTNDGWYGLFLILFFFWAIWTLAVFSLYQAQARFSQPASEAERPHERHEAESAGERAEPRPAPEAAVGRMEAAPQAPASALALQPPALALLAGFRATSLAVGAIQREPHGRWITARFTIGVIGMAILALGLGFALFLLIPRMWIGRTNPFSETVEHSAITLTGFTENVRLGDFGRILESTQKVMEVRLFDHETGERIGVEQYAAELGIDQPLFRGTVLGAYEDGGWSSGRVLRDLRASMPVSGRPAGGAVRQEIRLEPIGTDLLFALHPVDACEIVESRRGRERLRRQRGTSALVLDEGRHRRSTLSYHAYSPPGASQAAPPVDAGLPEAWLRGIRAQYLEVPDNLERMAALAREVVESGSRGGAASDREKALRLESYLRDSDRYEYALDASIQNASVDPIEDFLFYRRRGHCEYFASALVLMLRAEGIPARLVSGFKGGRENRFTGAYEVEQRHAHAWVEADIDGQWIVLDATPAARDESVDGMASRGASVRQLTQWASSIWSQYVVNMNFAQQQEGVYDPLRRAAQAWWEALKGNGGQAAGLLAGIKEFLASPDRWFSWQGGLVTFSLLLIVSGMAWLAKRLGGLLQSLRGRLRHGNRLRSMSVPIYERFREVCAAAGLVRGGTQTQREFAAEVEQAWRERLEPSGLSSLPTRLVDAFYDVRFGAEDLDPERGTLLERQLDRLEQVLAARDDAPASAGARLTFAETGEP